MLRITPSPPKDANPDPEPEEACVLYNNAIDTMTVAQNSWRYEWLTWPTVVGSSSGTYRIKLSAMVEGTDATIARAEIVVQVTE